MQYIKLSKAQMYGLIEKYSPYKLPDIDYTEFEKVHRSWSYWMRYSALGADRGRRHVVAHIEFYLGRASIRITCLKDGYDQIIHPALEDIEGMIHEDGRDAPWIIRYTKTDEMESFRGTDTQVLMHAEKEGRKRGSQYVIT